MRDHQFNPAARAIARTKHGQGYTLQVSDFITLRSRAASHAGPVNSMRHPGVPRLPRPEKRKIAKLKIVLAQNPAIPSICLVLGGTATLRLPIGAGGWHFFLPKFSLQGAFLRRERKEAKQAEQRDKSGE